MKQFVWKSRERVHIFSQLEKQAVGLLEEKEFLIAAGGRVEENIWPEFQKLVELETKLVSLGKEHFRLQFSITQESKHCLDATISFFCIDDQGEARDLGEHALTRLSEIPRIDPEG